MEAMREQLCESDLIATYVDGDMAPDVQGDFEEHLKKCAECRNEVRLHQQFNCELDAVLNNHLEVVIPSDFSRVVAASAVSDMRGVRSSSEKKRAIVFCVLLALGGFALIGGATRQLTVGLARTVVAGAVGLIDLIWHALYDLVLSIGVISKVLSRKFIVETGNGRTVVILLALGVLLLTRLIANYHRTSTND